MTQQRFKVPVFFPHSCLFLGLFIVLFLGITALLFVKAIGLGFQRLGFHQAEVFFLLLASFLGSAVNIPVKTYYTPTRTFVDFPSFFGIRYRIPFFQQEERSILAVNLGGCIIPVFISLILFFKMPDLWLRIPLSVVLCAFLVHQAARVVPGLGVTVPFFLPALLSALFAMLITPESAAAVAYITGALGTLIGADLMNLDRIKNLGAPVASIGGAGTWDGIFLSSLLASLLAH